MAEQDAATPLPIPDGLPAPAGATHYLELFSDEHGDRSGEPVAGGTFTILYFDAAGDLVETTQGEIP